MEKRNITVTLEKAIKWYNSDNDSLKELALQAFTKDELRFDFRSIKSLRDACEILNLSYNDILVKSNNIKDISKSAAAMFQLNIIKKALNLGQDLHLAKNPKVSYIYSPSNPLVVDDSTHYEYKRKMEVIGKIKSEGKEYSVLGGESYTNKCEGLGSYLSNHKLGFSYDSAGFLGCASKEIAEHFSRYFGVLITEVKYGDLEGVEIIEKA